MANRSGPNFDLKMYAKNVTDNGPELTIIDLATDKPGEQAYAAEPDVDHLVQQPQILRFGDLSGLDWYLSLHDGRVDDERGAAYRSGEGDRVGGRRRSHPATDQS